MRLRQKIAPSCELRVYESYAAQRSAARLIRRQLARRFGTKLLSGWNVVQFREKRGPALLVSRPFDSLERRFASARYMFRELVPSSELWRLGVIGLRREEALRCVPTHEVMY